MSHKPEDLELFHYGVKGMQWGVRRNRKGGVTTSTKSGNSRSSGIATGRKPSADHRKSRKIAKKSVDQMSNEELRTFAKRIQLEKSYAEATATPSVMKRGQKQVNNMLSYAQTAINVYQVATHPATKAGAKALGNFAKKVVTKNR